MEDVCIRFGKALRQRRHRLGVSQEEFADMCGLDRTYVGGIERGERNVSLMNIETLAKALGFPRRPIAGRLACSRESDMPVLKAPLEFSGLFSTLAISRP
jgi:transcriptional regulator with XRE-family HTH domain